MKIKLPLQVVLPRKKKEDKVFPLNMNTFRNAHYMIMNQAKIAWSEVVRDALPEEDFIPFVPPLILEYKFYPADKRRCDLANILPAVEKFTDDVLVDLGIIRDDNWKIVSAINYRVGELKKEDPHVTLEISEWR